MNIVETYLHDNKGVKLSMRSLAKRLNLKRKTVLYLASNSNILRKVNGLEVGNLGYRLNVFVAI